MADDDLEAHEAQIDRLIEADEDLLDALHT